MSTFSYLVALVFVLVTKNRHRSCLMFVLPCIIYYIYEDGLQKYCATAYPRSGVNQTWILKNSKELLDNLKSMSFSKVDSIKTFDFSTLYTTIPHDKRILLKITLIALQTETDIVMLQQKKKKKKKKKIQLGPTGGTS